MKREIIAMLTLSLLISGACTKERGDLKSESEIKFRASYENEVSTKAPTPFGTGNKATVIGFIAGADVTAASPVAGTPVELTGGAAGVLSPATPVYLPKGNYDFYSVSANDASSPGITFTSGLSAQLINGKDYLWAKQVNIAQGGTVILSYSHKAVGVEINIAAGSGVSSLTVTSIRFTPTKPESSSKMALSTGAIGSSTTKDALTSMNLESLRGRYIMLPLSSQQLDVEVTVNAVIGGVSLSGKVYSASIPSMSYTSGNYYTLNLTVSASSMTFSGSTVDDWATQTISGVTLTEV
ncbi:MAG: fimbrillin family protein [Bacteroidales bacterium]